MKVKQCDSCGFLYKWNHSMIEVKIFVGDNIDKWISEAPMFCGFNCARDYFTMNEMAGFTVKKIHE